MTPVSMTIRGKKKLVGSLSCMDELRSTPILSTLPSGDKQEDLQELGDFRTSRSDHTDEETGE